VPLLNKLKFSQQVVEEPPLLDVVDVSVGSQPASPTDSLSTVAQTGTSWSSQSSDEEMYPHHWTETLLESASFVSAPPPTL